MPEATAMIIAMKVMPPRVYQMTLACAGTAYLSAEIPVRLTIQPHTRRGSLLAFPAGSPFVATSAPFTRVPRPARTPSDGRHRPSSYAHIFTPFTLNAWCEL